MGVGLGYAIAAWAAYNLPTRRKRIIALEGDSALGFSGMEIETMARHRMDIVVVVMNNSGIYKGDASDASTWREMQNRTALNDTKTADSKARKGLRSTSLLHETGYEHLAQMVGGRGFLVRNEQELESATREALLEKEKVPCVLNVIIDPGLNMAAGFAWMETKEKHGGGGGSESKL
jgi:2-hydroxyacyl-CoA lyase 1